MWNRERSLHHVDIDGRLTLDEKLLLPEIEKGFQLNLFSIDQSYFYSKENTTLFFVFEKFINVSGRSSYL